MPASPGVLAGGGYEEQVPAALDLKPLQIDPPVVLKLFTRLPSYPKGGMQRTLLNIKRTRAVCRALVETPDEVVSTIWKR
jgi:hypothetical protein